jgi:hypothetical protein
MSRTGVYHFWFSHLATRGGVISMKKYLLTALTSAVIVAAGVISAPAYAFHCPALIKECLSTVDIISKRPGSDMQKLAHAKEGCEQAQSLHNAGKHKEAIITAGEAIAEAGKAAK